MSGSCFDKRSMRIYHDPQPCAYYGVGIVMHGPALSPQLLLAAYAQGRFPMGERRDDPTLYWVSPEKRGILPLDGFHVPRRLARTVRSGHFQVTSDVCFRAVMEA